MARSRGSQKMPPLASTCWKWVMAGPACSAGQVDAAAGQVAAADQVVSCVPLAVHSCFQP